MKFERSREVLLAQVRASKSNLILSLQSENHDFDLARRHFEDFVDFQSAADELAKGDSQCNG